MWKLLCSLLFVLIGWQVGASNLWKGEKLLIAGCGWDRVAILDKQTETLLWEHLLKKGEDCNDIEMTRQGEILYAYTKGARLVTLKQEVVWDYKVKDGEELFTATEISKKKYLLGICGHPARIVELDEKGNMVDEITFETGIRAVHGQFRQILKVSSDTYLIPLFERGEVIEMKRDGTVLRKVKTGGTLFSVKILPNGHWLVACGDAHKWVEIDPVLGREVNQVSDQVSSFALLFVAELHRYRNGNILVANWNGHSKDKTQPKIIEMDAKGRVVWYLKKDERIANVSAVYPFRRVLRNL